jgi:hypothetical protein
MALMVVLGVLLLGAGILVVRWRSRELVLPVEWRHHAGPPPPVLQLQLYLWFAALIMLTGLAVGVVVVGAGGRLAMRLLAATSPQSRGVLTEADQMVGRISLDGTVAFIVFGGLPGGFLAALFYVVLHRALPRGWLGGLVLGGLLLIGLGVRIDPLRPDNFDFAIVGPGWLAVTVYGLLALASGVAAAALAGRLSHALPLPRWSAVIYIPLLILLTLALSGSVWKTLLVLLGGAALFLLGHLLLRASTNATSILTLLMRGAVTIFTLTAMPRFLGAIREIIG